MANTTVRGAISIHGTNPQYLIEKVIRARIYDSIYWKEHCFALNAATLIDNACKLTHIGGTYANTRPTEFMCLALKLLQLQPEREIVLEYLRADEFKYLRALAAFYVRLTFDPVNVYEVLEPLLDDYRKIRIRYMNGSYGIITMDEFADQLLNDERVCEIQLPRLTQRRVLEETEALPPRRSKLGKALGVLGDDGGDDAGLSDRDGDEDDEDRDRYMSRSPSLSPSASPEPNAGSKTPEYWTEGSEDEDDARAATNGKARGRARTKSPAGSDGRYISRSPSAGSNGRHVSRSPTRSPEPDAGAQANVMSMELDTEKIEGDV